MAFRRALCSALALLGALGLVLGIPAAAAADDTIVFTLRDSRITESSGLARDLGAHGYWTVNDSGDSGIAYRVSPKGETTGTLKYRAKPVDVEAVAMHKGRLYVADIGDNAADRERIGVYYFNDAQADDQTSAYRSWEFHYPDGAHDAETLLVNNEGRLFIVTKGAPGGVYRAPQSPEHTAVNDLVRVGDAPVAVTDGTFLPDGDRIALLTALGTIEILDADTYEKVGSATVAGQGQMESMTVSLTGKSLLVGSEGENSRVYAVPMPDISSTAAPSATPSDDGDELDPADEEAASTTGQGRARTLLALGLAGLVAIAAGSVVVLAHKP
jgi:hypothetical protein